MQVTVVDGDTNRRVRGARVTIGARSARSDRHGVAHVKLLRRTALVTTAEKPGYGERAVRLSFRTHPKSTVRIYRRSLQWAMYGADPQRTQAHDDITVRPPFRVVWSRGLGTLIEFPAVVQDGVAYIANAKGTVRAISMRNGDIVWRHDTPRGKMAVVSRRLARPADRARDGRPRLGAAPLGRQAALALHRRLAGRVVTRDRQRRGRLRRLERDGHRARPADAQGALAALRRLQGHVVGRALGLDALHRRLLRPPAGAERAQRRDALVAERQRPRLRHAGGRGGARVRPELDRRLADGVFHLRPLSLAPDTGSYVYSSPAVAQGRVFFGSYNGVFYGLSARTGATLWSHGTGGPISGAATVVDGVAYAGSFAHRILGVDARSGRVVLELPAR